MSKRKRPTVAVIYDFDGTLSPGNMQEFGFIQSLGKSPEEFWQICNSTSMKYDASDVLTYMKIMLSESAAAGKTLRKETFAEFGSRIELFEGVREWFGKINAYGRRNGVVIEHYINSSGLAEMINGTDIAGEFKKIYACSYMYDDNGNAVWPAVAVDYTAKTQFLFKINKGILSICDSVLVNESWADDRKHVPFDNMIYIGDGETDVPCMKIVKMFGGHSIATYNPSNKGKEQTARKLFRQKRVNFMAPADYRQDAPLYRIVTGIIDKIRCDNSLKELESADKTKTDSSRNRF